jgi:hypothetical protein
MPELTSNQIKLVVKADVELGWEDYNLILRICDRKGAETAT